MYLHQFIYVLLVLKAILTHVCISSKLMLSDLMLSDLCNVVPMMTLPYKQPVGPMKAHGAVRQWANVVLPTLAQRK